MKNYDQQYTILKNRLIKLFLHPYNLNRNHINKVAFQMRYLEKFVRPEVKEVG